MANLSLDRMLFDPADAADSSNVGAYVRAGSDGDLVSSTLVGGKEGLDVNVINASLVVTATDLDIRNLVFATDKVDVSGSTVVVTATDLDVRDLSHTQDSIKIGDGTDFLAINADGSINVTALIGGQYAEDSAHTTGDIGLFTLAVRNDAETSLVSADGDYAPLQVTATGRLKVDADLSVTNSSEKAEDSAHTTGDIGAFTLGVRQDTLTSSVDTDGDYAAFKLNARGAMWTSPVGTAADDAADTENPVKVGGKAYTGASALTAVSAGDRTDQATDLYRRIYINDAPNVAVQSTRVTVGTSAVALPTTALAGRTRMTIQNISNSKIWIGPTGVTTSGAATGLEVGKGNSLSIEAGQGVTYYAIAGGAGNDVVVFEQA